jgi:hypothetical protein
MLAAREGHIDIVKYLLDNGADVNRIFVTERFEGMGRGSSALMWAAKKGHPEVVKYLVDHSAHVNYIDKVAVFYNLLIVL